MSNIPPGLLLEGVYSSVPAPTQRGLSTPFCRRQTGRWSPITGWTLDQDFNSISLATMEAIAAQCQSAGVEYELTFQNGVATMRTVDTTGNITIDVWEVVASRIAASVFASPAVVQSVSPNDLTVLTRAYLDGSTPAEAVTALNGTTPPPTVPYTEPDTVTPSVTQRLYQKTKNGEEATFFTDQYSLRHTTTASNRGYFNVANVNVNCIYTQSQFYSEIQNIAFWIFPAPPEIIGELNAVFAGLGTPPANFVSGALKGGATRITSARNKVNITTEYILGIIDSDNYFAAV